jgi:protein YIPF5/7
VRSDWSHSIVMADPFGSPLPQQYTYGVSSGSGYSAYARQEPWNPYQGHGVPTSVSSGFEDEPPILEELGIDIAAILRKSKCVLIGRVGSDSLKDIDMGGPLLFAACLAAIHLLSAKLHFGIIIGWSAVSHTLFWFIIHQLAGHGAQSEKECIDLYNCSACLGYCLLPMVLVNAMAIFLPHGSSVVIALFVLASMYCSLLAARLVTKRAQFLQGQLATIAYPAFLYYITIALISLY